MLTGGSVDLHYGDSMSSTYASGPVAQDIAAIAGLSMPQQAFAAISDTNDTVVMEDSNGIFGLGFPSMRCVLNAFFVVQAFTYKSSEVQSAVITAKVYIY
jgi:hypothetical protein